jgi:hypothetical protein
MRQNATPFYGTYANLLIEATDQKKSRMPLKLLVNWVESAQLLRRNGQNQRETWKLTMENLEKQPQRRIVSHHFWKWVRVACVGRFPHMTISFAVCVSFAGTGPPCSLRERYNVGPTPRLPCWCACSTGAPSSIGSLRAER